MCLLIQLQSWVSNEVSSAPVLQKPLVPNPKRVHCLLPAAPGYQMNSWVVRTSWNPNLHVTSYKSQVIYIRESPMEAPTNFFRTSNKVDFPGFTLRFFRWPVKDSGNPTAKHLKKKTVGVCFNPSCFDDSNRPTYGNYETMSYWLWWDALAWQSICFMWFQIRNLPYSSLRGKIPPPTKTLVVFK